MRKWAQQNEGRSPGVQYRSEGNEPIEKGTLKKELNNVYRKKAISSNGKVWRADNVPPWLDWNSIRSNTTWDCITHFPRVKFE